MPHYHPGTTGVSNTGGAPPSAKPPVPQRGGKIRQMARNHPELAGQARQYARNHPNAARGAIMGRAQRSTGKRGGSR